MSTATPTTPPIENISVRNKFNSLMKRLGPVGLVGKVFSKFIYRKTDIVLLELDFNKPQKKYKKSTLWESRQLTEDDLPACKKYFSNQVNIFQEFLDLGYYSYAGFCTKTGDVIAIIWFADKEYYDKYYYEYSFPVKTGQVFQFAAEVAKPFRNKHVSVEISQLGWSEMQKKGINSSYCTVNESNTPSLRIQFHMGFEEIGTMLTMHELFKFKWFTQENYNNTRFDHLNKHKRRRSA